MVHLAGHGAEHGHPVIYPFGAFLVEIIEMAHCPGCDASRPIRGECLVNAKVRRGLGLVPCLPKSPKAIHTLGIVVCRIIKEPWSLSGVPYMLPPFFKDQRLER